MLSYFITPIKKYFAHFADLAECNFREQNSNHYKLKMIKAIINITKYFFPKIVEMVTLRVTCQRKLDRYSKKYHTMLIQKCAFYAILIYVRIQLNYILYLRINLSPMLVTFLTRMALKT